MRRGLVLLPVLLALAGCTGGGLGCAGRELIVQNASQIALEQLYAGSGAPDGWGRDLLAPGEVPPGARMSVRLAGGGEAVRAVWADGRAAEIKGTDVCRIQRLTVRDGALQAE